MGMRGLHQMNGRKIPVEDPASRRADRRRAMRLWFIVIGSTAVATGLVVRLT